MGTKPDALAHAAAMLSQTHPTSLSRGISAEQLHAGHAAQAGHAVRSALAAAEEAYANSGVIFDEGDGAGDGSCAESADQHENASDTLISSALDMLRHKV